MLREDACHSFRTIELPRDHVQLLWIFTAAPAPVYGKPGHAALASERRSWLAHDSGFAADGVGAPWLLESDKGAEQGGRGVRRGISPKPFGFRTRGASQRMFKIPR